MSLQRFWSFLLLLTLVISCILFFTPSLQGCQGFSILSLMLFTGITILMFMAGSKAATSENKSTFINIIMLFVLLKMVLSIILLFIYNKQAHPADKTFLIPFFITYLAYTGFETWFMIALGKKK